MLKKYHSKKHESLLKVQILYVYTWNKKKDKAITYYYSIKPKVTIYLYYIKHMKPLNNLHTFYRLFRSPVFNQELGE